MAGTAARFDAATDRVSYVPSGTGDPPNQPFTVAMWVYPSATIAEATSLYRRYTSGGTRRGQIGTAAAGSLALTWWPSEVAFGYTMPVGQWSRVAAVVATDQVTLYAGAATGDLTVATGSSGTGIDVANQITLAGVSVGSGAEWHNGRLARVRTWSAALTETELENEFASATPVRTANLWVDWPLAIDLLDASGNARHLAAGGTAVTFTEDGPPDTAPPHAEGTVTLAAVAALLESGLRGASGSVGLNAVGAAGVVGTRASFGSVELAATADLVAVGVHAGVGSSVLPADAALLTAGSSHRTGSVTLAATGAVRVSGGNPEGLVTPAERTFVVAAESRVLTVVAESRVLEVT